jgi:nanoRNase/pAp phosphatase (c-di-AMP/oligoRNAs hydrolase)
MSSAIGAKKDVDKDNKIVIDHHSQDMDYHH